MNYLRLICQSAAKLNHTKLDDMRVYTCKGQAVPIPHMNQDPERLITLYQLIDNELDDPEDNKR